MKRKKRSKPQATTESRSMEVLTIGWMLMVVTTLGCEVGFVAARWISGGTQGPLMMLSQLLLFAALVIGLVTLLITPVVVRGRRLPPPPAVTAFAVVIAAAPLAMAAVEMLK
jgi:membrane protein YdbS with pleckstrin-like domain